MTIENVHAFCLRFSRTLIQRANQKGSRLAGTQDSFAIERLGAIEHLFKQGCGERVRWKLQDSISRADDLKDWWSISRADGTTVLQTRAESSSSIPDLLATSTTKI